MRTDLNTKFDDCKSPFAKLLYSFDPGIFRRTRYVWINVCVFNARSRALFCWAHTFNRFYHFLNFLMIFWKFQFSKKCFIRLQQLHFFIIYIYILIFFASTGVSGLRFIRNAIEIIISFFFYAGLEKWKIKILLEESFRRQPGWRFTAGIQFSGQLILLSLIHIS